ncbi:MAG: ammonium transporter [Planctomycetales bacterium]
MKRCLVPLLLTGFLCCVIPTGPCYAQPAPAAAAPAAAAPAAAAEPAKAEPAPNSPEGIAKSIEELKTKAADGKVALDTVWVMVAGMLVFFMNLGFAAVESGMCRAKNCVNILAKNFVVFAVASIAYWALGWGLMFGDGNDYIGQKGLWFLTGADNSPATLADYKGDYGAINWTGVPLLAKFFFQLVFAGTCATIVSGAVAERIKYHSFIIFSFLICTFIYPVVGHWIWGGGWLAKMGFVDFAGSTQVHSIGGWAALVGILVLGPRIGKYGVDGKVNAIPAHSFPLATIGCFVLWLGWFGFNPGSTMAADPSAIADIAVCTNTAAAFATLSSTITAWLLLGKPDLGMTLNGCLAGLVAVTAPCAFITVPQSAIIGLIGGVLVVIGVIGFDRLKIDDPVGATSVHLLNGVFGTLCVGIFSDPKLIVARTGNTAAKGGFLIEGQGMQQFITQLTGVAATAGYVLVSSLICWIIIKVLMGIRVTAEEEMEGLDHGEHGNEAYHGFVMSPSGSFAMK